MEYHGRLSSVDSYMNVKLTNTEEWKDSKNEGSLGEVFIRLCPPFHIYQLLTT
jgi:small nuclear ribonucleoprotein (snRNP)-like protein